MRIRDDFEGVVHVPGRSGVVLRAGDALPEIDGHEWGEHLLDGEPESSEKPAGNASIEAWQEYARSKGATDADLDGKSRNELREQYGN